MGPSRRRLRLFLLAVLPAVLGACATAVPASTGPISPGTGDAPREVIIVAHDYRFDPAPVDVVPGETILFHVLNGGLEVHEVVIGDAAVQDAWEAAEAASDSYVLLGADGHKAHPTQKPEALLYRILLACTKPGDVVLDPFFGTGTTGAVARRLGRRWIGIEREADYVKVARERIASTLPLDESAMQTVTDKRDQPRVAFGALVENGMVPPGSKLTDAKRRWTASVRADGSITCTPHSGSIHHVGAALQGAPSCNGWTFWHVEQGGSLQPLDTFRQRHLAALA